MVLWSVGLPVILADKNTPADIGRFLNCRLPLAPLDYGKTCACLFRDISHMQHLHSADSVVGRTHRLCGQIKAALWLLSFRIALTFIFGFGDSGLWGSDFSAFRFDFRYNLLTLPCL